MGDLSDLSYPSRVVIENKVRLRMKKIIFLVVIAVAALYHFKPGLFLSSGANGAFDSKGNPQVVVFTTKECNGACERAVQDLNDRKVDFQEVRLDGNDDNIRRYEKLDGNGVVPYIVVGGRSVRGFEKSMMASVLAQTYGDKYLTRLEQVYFNDHFRADGTPVIHIYGASWCAFCKALREELSKRKIDFTEVDVEAASDRVVMTNTMEIGGFPITYVGYERVVGGERVDAVLDALKRAGKRRT